MREIIDLTGKRFGKLVVVKREGTRYRKCGCSEPTWLCKCDCGKYTVAVSSRLRFGRKKSCGCSSGEFISKSKTKHGDRRTRLYFIWTNMKQRCKNKNNSAFKNYGGRGIKICPDWESYANFKKWAFESGYSDSLTIDRIDVNGDYCPENCRWITMKEQGRNTRVNVLITHNGETHCLAEWEDIKNMRKGTLTQRLTSYGYTEEEALEVPLGMTRKQYRLTLEVNPDG